MEQGYGIVGVGGVKMEGGQDRDGERRLEGGKRSMQKMWCAARVGSRLRGFRLQFGVSLYSEGPKRGGQTGLWPIGAVLDI